MDERKTTFPISTGIICAKHRQRMGIAIWEFLWLIDRTTREMLDNEGRWGMVLGGKPLQAEDIAQSLGIHNRTVRRNLKTLEDGGYIRTSRVNGGIIIWVRNSIKWHWRHNGSIKGFSKQGVSAGSRPGPPGFRPSEVDWEAEAKRGL